MTDNEIIKTLERCRKGYGCEDCPLNPISYDSGCMLVCIDLINRQKAKIERLKRYDKERDIILHSRLTEKARTDGIKEFAERLKKAFYYNDAIKHNIDNLAKEMIGNDNDR